MLKRAVPPQRDGVGAIQSFIDAEAMMVWMMHLYWPLKGIISLLKSESKL